VRASGRDLEPSGSAWQEPSARTDDPALPVAADPAAARTPRRYLLGAALGFVVLFLLQAPGKLTADTKLDVPMEPLQFLERATHLWNSSAEFGYIPNQALGYLFPMGPFFLLGKLLAVPPWITQRLWMALLLTVAAWGLVRLADTLRLGRPVTRLLGGLAYALSPVFLGKVGATSVALTGAAMLPWIVLPLLLALRPDGAGGEDTGIAAPGGCPDVPAGSSWLVRRFASRRAGAAGGRTDDALTDDALADGSRAHDAGAGRSTGRLVTAAARLSPRRAAALSGLAILCTGGVNASVTLCVLLCPAVLLVLAGGSRRAWALRGWWLVSVVLATAWWVVGLVVQSRYGLNFLPYTETVATTTSTTSVAEVVRGTADWLAYLRLPSAWLPAASDYVTSPTAIVGSALGAAISLWGLAHRDLPGRRFLLVTFGVGIVAVAAGYPGQPGSPVAGGVRALLEAQLSPLRNVYKFEPVSHLPMALGFTHALTVALRRRRPSDNEATEPTEPVELGGSAGSTHAVAAPGGRTPGGRIPDRGTHDRGTADRGTADRGTPDQGTAGRRGSLARLPAIAAVALAIAALIAGVTPVLGGKTLQSQPFSHVPGYWVEAADWLADNPDGGRTLVLPGTAFAEYDWGRPLDEPLQWLSQTPWGVRSLIPLGGVGITRWMDAIETELSRGNAAGLGAALARAGVGQVLVRNDIDNKNWDVPPSTDEIHRALTSSGLQPAATFGPSVVARAGAKARLVPALSNPTDRVPALEVWTVPDGAKMVEAYSAASSLVVSGGPEATVQLAAHGLLSPDRGAVLASDLADLGSGSAGGADEVIASTPPADAPPASDVLTDSTGLAVTDTFKRRDYTYGIVHSSGSYLLGPDESVAGKDTPPNQWIDRPAAGHQTVAGYTGGMSVQASSYGYELFSAPDLAPSSAVDGFPGTAWTARPDASSGSGGAWLQLDVGQAISVPYIGVQLLDEGSWRPVPQALRVTTAAGSVVTRVLGNEKVQQLNVPTGPSSWFRITLENLVRDTHSSLGAGIREVTIPGVRFQRYAQVPSDATSLAAAPAQGPVEFAFDRDRVDPAQPFGGSEELAMARRFEVPRPMRFTLTGYVSALPPPAGTPVPDDLPLDIACGEGPEIIIDGIRYPVRIEGRTTDATSVRPMKMSVCTPDGTVPLHTGSHLLTVEQGTSTMIVDAISLVGAGTTGSDEGPRSTSAGSWTAERRTVAVGAGGKAFLAVHENANASWTASLNGVTLTPVRLDGWQQGWIVPAGAGGTVVIENKPGESFRRDIAVGLVLVLALLLAALLPGRIRLRPGSDQDGYPVYLDPARVPLLADVARLPGRWVALVAATVAVGLVAGPVALAVPVLAVIARRRPAVLPWLAAVCTVGAGIAVAIVPDGQPGDGRGAFSWHVQLLGALAFAATVAALSLPRSPTRVPGEDPLPSAGSTAEPRGAREYGSPGRGGLLPEDTMVIPRRGPAESTDPSGQRDRTGHDDQLAADVPREGVWPAGTDPRGSTRRSSPFVTDDTRDW
jgi:arabinofuranan 3-O-arabinosyltransferase